MSKNIDSYFSKFSDIPPPDELRDMRRGVRVVTSGNSFGPVRGSTYLPEDAWQYAYVGKIAVDWANLEHMIDRQIWKLCGSLGQSAACLTSQMIGPAPRLFALIALCHEKGIEKDTISEIEEFKRHAGAVGEDRNRFVHDSWHVSWGTEIEDTTVKLQVTAKGPLSVEAEVITKERLERVIYKIRRLTDIFDIRIRSELLRQTGF